MARESPKTFLEHLSELRRRLLRTVLVLVAASGAGLALAEPLLRLILRPYGDVLIVIGPTESVATYLRIALAVGISATIPYALGELWAFVRPGLRPGERRYAAFLVPAALLLFLLGASFAWFALIPAAIRFLAGVGPKVFRTQWTADRYVPFVTSLVVWIGASFELPVLAFVLARLRIVTARALARGWRVGILLIVVAAAIITPTVDPFNMLLVGAPLLALYAASIGVAALARRGRSPFGVEGAGPGDPPGSVRRR